MDMKYWDFRWRNGFCFVGWRNERVRYLLVWYSVKHWLLVRKVSRILWKQLWKPQCQYVNDKGTGYYHNKQNVSSISIQRERSKIQIYVWLRPRFGMRISIATNKGTYDVLDSRRDQWITGRSVKKYSYIFASMKGNTT